MARYQIELNDESLIEADDARFVCDGKFVELIPRRAAVSEGTPERMLINASQVRTIHYRPVGFKGGWRFDGSKDASFEPSEGSI